MGALANKASDKDEESKAEESNGLCCTKQWGKAMTFSMITFRPLGVAAIVAALCFISAPAYAGCSGNACDQVSIQKKAGCIVIRNMHPSKRIRVEGNDKFTAVVYVYANSEETPILFGKCFVDWYSNYMSNFAS